MPSETIPESPSTPPTGRPSSGSSHLVHRVHLYLGLFLAPWMLMYALSTLFMEHRPFVQSFYATEKPQFTVEREMNDSRTLAPGTTPK